MSNYETRQLALELALRAASRDESIVDIVAAASEFEKYLSGEEKTTNPGAFTEPVKPGAFADMLPRGMVSLGLTKTEAERAKDAFDRCDGEMVAILILALREAFQLGQNKVQPLHLLLAILKHGQSDAHAALIEWAGNGRSARKAIIDRITSS